MRRVSPVGGGQGVPAGGGGVGAVGGGVEDGTGVELARATPAAEAARMAHASATASPTGRMRSLHTFTGA